jgi:predicted house-cleaning noncanonical NTP pyrophosphatase (MazG superfamily)
MQKIFKCEKLIRDNLPKLLNEMEIDVRLKTLNEEEYSNALIAKLFEECLEVKEAKSKEEQCEELADVIEVIRAFAKRLSICLEDIVMLADKKAHAKGGFENRVYCTNIAIDENNPRIEYYRSKSKEYPEI